MVGFHITNPALTGLEPEKETEKTEKKEATEEGIEENFPKREVIKQRLAEWLYSRNTLIYNNKKIDSACRTRQQDRFV